jgi:hypothetical protein
MILRMDEVLFARMAVDMPRFKEGIMHSVFSHCMSLPEQHGSRLRALMDLRTADMVLSSPNLQACKKKLDPGSVI